MTGNRKASNDLLIGYLRYEAYKKGADAIINVKKQFKNRETGLLMDTDEGENYSAAVFTGVAVKYIDAVQQDSSQELASYTSYRKLVEDDMQSNRRRVRREVAISVLSAIAVVIVVLVKNH